jgi:hypothetical protein
MVSPNHPVRASRRRVSSGYCSVLSCQVGRMMAEAHREGYAGADLRCRLKKWKSGRWAVCSARAWGRHSRAIVMRDPGSLTSGRHVMMWWRSGQTLEIGSGTFVACHERKPAHAGWWLNGLPAVFLRRRHQWSTASCERRRLVW